MWRGRLDLRCDEVELEYEWRELRDADDDGVSSGRYHADVSTGGGAGPSS